MDLSDPFRMAAFLTQQHGKAAPAYVLRRMLDMRAVDDEEGQFAWLRVFDVLLERPVGAAESQIAH